MKIITKDTNINSKVIESLEWEIKCDKNYNKHFISYYQQKDYIEAQLSPRTINHIYAYRNAINIEAVRKIEGKSAKDVFPTENIVACANTTSHFNGVNFTKFTDFRNVLFLCDIDFREAKFKEVGLFDGCFFFNARKLGLVNENNNDSLVDLNIDNAYFNLLKGVSFDQVFPHLHKRLKYDKIKFDQEKQCIIDNYIYLQENFGKIGRFEDADKIYYERKVLEAEKETCWWKIAWNWILDITCNYGTDFEQIVLV